MELGNRSGGGRGSSLGGGGDLTRGGGGRNQNRDGLAVFLVFDVKDHTKPGLDKIEKSLESIQNAHEGIENAAARVEDQAHSLRSAFEHLQHEGHALEAAGERGMRSFENMAHHAIEAAGEFDNLRAQMRFAFEESTEQAFSNLRTFEQNSAYSMAELTESVAALRSAFREIDPTDLTPRFSSATGQMQSGLEALSDAAAGAGVSLGETIQIVERALEGNFQSIAYQMRLSGEEVNEMRAKVNAAANDQEKYNAIVEALAAHWGGAQRTMGGTFGMLQTRLRSITHLLWAELGEKGLEPIKELMDELHAMFRDMLADKKFIEAISSGFRMVAEAVKVAGQWLIRVVTKLREMASSNPAIVKLIGVVWALGSALMVVAGKAMVLAGSIGMSALALKTVGVTVGGLAVMVVKAGAIILAAGAALALLWKGVTRAWASDFMGIKTIFDRVSAVVRGLYEAFSNWGGEATMISEQTARDLHRSGILDWFIQAIGWASRTQQWFQGVWDALKEGWEEASPSLLSAWRELEQTFRIAWGSIKQALLDAGVIQEATTENFKNAKGAGHSFGNILKEFVVPAILMFADLLRQGSWTIEHIAIPAFLWILETFKDIKNFFDGDGSFIITALRAIVYVLGVGFKAATMIFRAGVYAIKGALFLITLPVRVFATALDLAASAAGFLVDKLKELDQIATGGRLTSGLSSVRDSVSNWWNSESEGMSEENTHRVNQGFGNYYSRSEAQYFNRRHGREQIGDWNHETTAQQRSRWADEHMGGFRTAADDRSFYEYASPNAAEQASYQFDRDRRYTRGKTEDATAEGLQVQAIKDLTRTIREYNERLYLQKVPTVAIGDEQIAAAARNGVEQRLERGGSLSRQGHGGHGG